MKISRSHIILFSFVALFAFNKVNGQNLNDYLIMAAENNPGLKGKYYDYQASLEKVPQVTALPDPQLSFGFFIKPMERYIGNQVAEIALMQMFPWFGTLGAAKNEAASMAKAKYESFNETKSILFYEVKATWYALYLLEKEITITEENLRILKSLEQIAISRFKSGGTGGGKSSQSNNRMAGNRQAASTETAEGMSGMTIQGQSASGNTPGSTVMSDMGSLDDMGGSGSLIDVLRVQMEINELNNTLALLKDSKQPLLSQFNKLLNRPSNETVVIPGSILAATLPVPVSEIPDSIRQNNPMLKMLEKDEEAFLAKEKMNRKMGFPMIGLGVQYAIFEPRPDGQSMMNGQNMLMPMATVTIPLWRKKYNASVREAGFLREAVIEQRQDVSNQLMVNYEEALKDFRDAERRRELYQQQTDLAQQSLDLLTVQYATAGSNFEEVLRLQQQMLNYRLQGLIAFVDGNIAVAMLERLMGR